MLVRQMFTQMFTDVHMKGVRCLHGTVASVQPMLMHFVQRKVDGKSKYQ